jgi:phospholipid transport system substrate-binding protein
VVQRSGRWLVNDVSIDGASIVATYHAQFSRILREGSFSDLMEFLKQKAVVA